MSSARATSEGGRRVRLQRVLADAGVAARKQCERLIETGHVEVNGERVEKLPIFVDPDGDEIRVDGRLIKPVTRHTYVMWHKPSRVLATPPADEEDSRPSVSDYVDHPTAPRLFPVGTLGFEASGLMLLTSNTKAATLLSHPRSRVERLYHARVKGTPTGTVRSKLNKGVQVLVPERGKEPPGAEKPAVRTMERGANRPKNKPTMRRVRLEIRALDPSKRNAQGEGFISESEPRRPAERGTEAASAGNSSIEILTTEPRDEYVAQALHLVGHPVRKLLRLGIGPLRLREVGPGAWRELSRDEMKALRAFLNELSGEKPGSGRNEARGGGGASGGRGGLGASRGPGKRRPRVVGGDEKKPAKVESVSDQQSREEPGVDPEDFEE